MNSDGPSSALPPASPFAQLQRSHRRLEERLRDLEDATARLASDGEDGEAWETCDAVLRFLGRAVARHEADEEASLFPRLGDASELRAIVTALAAEHETQRALTASLEKAVNQRASAAELDVIVRALSASYAAHIRQEEEEL